MCIFSNNNFHITAKYYYSAQFHSPPPEGQVLRLRKTGVVSSAYWITRQEIRAKIHISDIGGVDHQDVETDTQNTENRYTARSQSKHQRCVINNLERSSGYMNPIKSPSAKGA